MAVGDPFARLPVRVEVVARQRAGQRAEALLLRFCTPEQQRTWRVEHRVYVTTRRTWRYWVRRRYAIVARGHRAGVFRDHPWLGWQFHCIGFHPSWQMPVADHVLGLKLLLEGNLRHFHRHAVRFPVGTSHLESGYVLSEVR